MDGQGQARATMCVVNYKTLDLTRLCLRSIRKFTRPPYDVIVVDNDSQDASTEYLRSLKWIRLIERKDKTNDSSGGYAHAAALDLALAQTQTEFFVAMHSDTFVHRDNWLGQLLALFQNNPQVACVGAGKVELTPTWQIWLKKATDFKTLIRKLLRTPDPLGMHRYYNRTVCSIYRTEILKKEQLSFLMDRDKGLTVGKKLYFELVDRGYKTVELSDGFMKQYLYHLAHATQVINAGQFNLRSRTVRKTSRLIDKIMQSGQVRQILADASLDE
jgi:cellulose synthase/poly-beta-1,6-N-acetylglucosamine synthase-like glycosyltransferase